MLEVSDEARGISLCPGGIKQKPIYMNVRTSSSRIGLFLPKQTMIRFTFSTSSAYSMMPKKPIFEIAGLLPSIRIYKFCWNRIDSQVTSESRVICSLKVI